MRPGSMRVWAGARTPISMTFAARWLLNTRQTLAGFDHLIAVSPYLESYLRLKHGFRGEIRVIPNAIVELPADLVVPQVFPKSGQVTFATFGEPGKAQERSLSHRGVPHAGAQHARYPADRIW